MVKYFLINSQSTLIIFGSINIIQRYFEMAIYINKLAGTYWLWWWWWWCWWWWWWWWGWWWRCYPLMIALNSWLSPTSLDRFVFFFFRWHRAAGVASAQGLAGATLYLASTLALKVGRFTRNSSIFHEPNCGDSWTFHIYILYIHN